MAVPVPHRRYLVVLALIYLAWFVALARQERLDEALVYTPQQLDRDVVSESQMRTIIRHFRQVLFTELFPCRPDQIVPKTLIFAKDDNHAENIVRIVREE